MEELLELMRRCGYSEKVIEYFKNKVNMGRMENPDWVSEQTGSCGDTITEMVKKKPLEEAKKITEKDVLESLGGLPESKLDCVKLTVTAMRRTIAEYMALGPFKSNEINARVSLL